MRINVHLNRPARKQINFWNHIHFHPTDAIEDRWGQRILGRIERDHAAKMIRMHTMFEDMVTRGADGALKYDFSDTDARIDYLTAHGFELLLCFDFMPVCMASDPLTSFSGVRYKNKRFNRSAPKDYAEWEEVCRVYTRHLIDRYGEERVSKWYFHCWNEPDGGFWINVKNNDTMDADGDMDKIEEYFKLYDYFEKGVTAVTRRVKLGGPSCAGSDRFMRLFLDHALSGTSAATGKRLKFDFIGVHCYSQGIYSALPNKTYVSPDNIMQRLHTVHEMLTKAGAPDLEIFFDEWGMAGGGFIGIDRDPRMLFRETEFFPAFYARLIDKIIKAPELNLQHMMICLSGQHECKKDFDGYRTFFTLNGFAKPIYNGYALAAKLGDKYLDNDAPDDPLMGLIPTMDESGRVAVMAYRHYDEFYKTCGNDNLTLRFDGLKGRYTLRHWRIDAQSCNAYKKWLELGSPVMPDFSQREIIDEAAALKEYVPDETIEADGSYALTVTMTQNAVSLIELIPVK